MLVSYTSDSGDVLRWTYSAPRVRQSRAELIERHFGDTFDDFNKAVLAGSARARRVLLWHCLTSDHPAMKFADTPDFAMADVVVEFDADELARLKEAVTDSDADDAAKQDTLAKLDKMIADLPADLPKA